MTALSSIFGWLDDWINPIVVKELRQAVRSRFIVSVMLLFLVLQLIVVGFVAVAITDARSGPRSGAGREVFAGLLVFLHCACLIAVPVYAGARFASERSETNVDLFFISTLKPRAIIRGKLLSAMILSALFYSLCAPFMVFTYLLRGIDLPTIFAALVMGLLAALVAAQFAIFVAALPLNRIFRSIAALAGLWALAGLLFGVVGAAFMLLRFGYRGGLADPELLMTAGLNTCIGLFVAGLLFEVCVAIISPPTANRAVGFRLFFSAAWLATAAAAVALSVHTGRSVFVESWAAYIWLLLSAALLGCVSERETIGPRLRGQIPRHRLLRPLAFLFYSGAGGGALWVGLMALATLAIGGFDSGSMATWSHSHYGIALGSAPALLCLYAFGYGFAALLLWRLLLHRWTPKCTVGLQAVILAAALMLLFIFVYAIVDINSLDRLDHMFLPGMCISDRNDQQWIHLAFAGLLAIAVGVPHARWLLRQWRDFQPLERQAVQTAEAPHEG